VVGSGRLRLNLTGFGDSHFASESDLVQFVQKARLYGKLYGRNGQGSGRMPGFGNLLTDEQLDSILSTYGACDTCRCWQSDGA